MKRRLGLVALGVVMVALSFAVTKIRRIGPFRHLSLTILGWVGIVFFGLCLIYAIYRLVVVRPSLEVTEEGFVDNASAVAAGFIPWSNVAGFALLDIANQSMISVRLHDRSTVVASRNPIKNLLRRANRSFGGDLFIPQIQLSAPIADVEQTMRRAMATFQASTRPLPPPNLSSS